MKIKILSFGKPTSAIVRSLIVFLLCAFSFFTNNAQTSERVIIAFGSCSNESKPQTFWKSVIAENPSMWIWMGDNIYGDTEDMQVMAAKYDKQKSNEDYQRLLKSVKVIGTWDDHDYGVNDGGREYAMKEQSKDLMLQFLGVPQDHPVRSHHGVYSSYVLGAGGKKIKIILLDTRSFRDSLKKSLDEGKLYASNPSGDMLGEEQWKWLEKELKSSRASLHIIGSSIQFIAQEHGYEKWMNLKSSYDRMIELLARVKPKNLFFISGDRHIAELSRLQIPDLPYPLFDLTASGLTHSWNVVRDEPNRYRVGDLIVRKNYGVLTVEWIKGKPLVNFLVKGENGTQLFKYAYQY